MSESDDEPDRPRPGVAPGGDGGQTGANVCPECAGVGRLAGAECGACGGRGTVEEPVGDA